MAQVICESCKGTGERETAYDCDIGSGITCMMCGGRGLLGETPDELRLSTPEPAPNKKAQGPEIWPLVIKDMEERNRVGAERYGTPLCAFNNRDPMIDAFQEALDLVVYFRQLIYEKYGR